MQTARGSGYSGRSSSSPRSGTIRKTRNPHDVRGHHSQHAEAAAAPEALGDQQTSGGQRSMEQVF